MRESVKRKCCPLCGGAIIISYLYQTSHEYRITKSGKIANRFKRYGEHPLDSSFATCSNNGQCYAYWSEMDFSVDNQGYFWDEKYVEVDDEN